jgi:hypothetical protein
MSGWKDSAYAFRRRLVLLPRTAGVGSARLARPRRGAFQQRMEGTGWRQGMTSRDVLMITGMEGAANFAEALAAQIGGQVEVASTRKTGLASLRRGQFAVVVVEESLVEGDADWADQVWAGMGLAIPVQVNFSISGGGRLVREVKSALARREVQYEAALKAAELEVKNELRGSLTGLLLQSELALREPAGSDALGPKLKMVVELAGAIRNRFERPEM